MENIDLSANTFSEVTEFKDTNQPNFEEICYKDKYIRLLADFQNYKRNKEKEIDGLIKNGGKEIILKMLPFFEDVDRMFECDFVEGIKSPIYSSFYKMLDEINLIPIGVKGEKFDENIHNCVFLTEYKNKDIPSGYVSEVVKNGYIFNKEIIQHADVGVEK